MGKFTIRETNGKFNFRLKSDNGLVIATSQQYATLLTCKAGIASVRANAAAAAVEDQTQEGFAVLAHPKFEMYVDTAGEFRFRLKAKNGQIIAVGESYKKKPSCLNGIESIKKNAPEAELKKAF